MLFKKKLKFGCWKRLVKRSRRKRALLGVAFRGQDNKGQQQRAITTGHDSMHGRGCGPAQSQMPPCYVYRSVLRTYMSHSMKIRDRIAQHENIWIYGCMPWELGAM